MKNKTLIIVLFIDFLLVVAASLNFWSLYVKSTIPGTIDNGTEVTVAAQNLLAGDIIVEVGGFDCYNWREIEFACDHYNIGDKVDVVVARNDTHFEVPVSLVPYYDWTYLLVLIIVGIIFIGPGIYVFVRNPYDKAGKLFHWLLVSAGLMIVLTSGSLTPYPFWINFLIRVLYTASLIFTPITFLHFSFYIPKRKWEKSDRFFYVLYFLGLTATIFLSIINFDILKIPNLIVVRIFFNYHLIIAEMLFLYSFVFILGNFIHSYIVFKEESARRQLLWFFVGISFGPAVYILLYLLPRIIFGSTLVSETVMLMATAVAPISFFIAVVSYRFVDINFIINRSVVYSMFLILVLGVYTGILVLFTHVLHESAANYSQYAALTAALITSLGLQKSKSFLQKNVDKIFFSIKFNLNLLRNQFDKKLKSCISPRDVLELINETLKKAVETEKILIISNYNSETQEIINDGFTYNTKEQSIIQNFIDNKLSGLIGNKTIFEAGINFEPVENGLFGELAPFLYIHRSEKSTTINILALDEKKSFQKYSHEDIGLISYLMLKSSVAIEKLELQRELILKNEEAEKLQELNKLKSYFVSSVSHDLKTPLTSIRLFAEIMEKKSQLPYEKKQDYLRIIQTECDRLNRLINNVLNFSKIEKGSKQYNFEMFDLKNNLEHVIKTLEDQLVRQKFDTIVDLQPGEYELFGDPDSITEVFINLISNSMKYSMDNKKIKIKLYRSKYYIVTEIIDSGIGISDADKEKIFEAFYRSGNENAQRAGGAGIGLSIVKNIIEAHDGKIEIESKLGSGSKFSVYLPINGEL